MKLLVDNKILYNFVKYKQYKIERPQAPITNTSNIIIIQELFEGDMTKIAVIATH